MKRIEFYSFSITPREVLVAIAIITLLLTLGIKISDMIERSAWDKSSIYTTAAQADNPSTYQWLVKTNIGNLLAYGTAECIDPVHIEGLDGEYWYIERDYQQYRQHSRQVPHTYTDSNGRIHTYYTTEYYWTWDTIDTKMLNATKFTFLGITYNCGDLSIDRPYAPQVKEDEFAHHERYIYYAAPTSMQGTVFTNISNNVYSNSNWYEDQNIEQVIESKSNLGTVGKVIFWIFWIPLTLVAAGVYIYIDNDYLED